MDEETGQVMQRLQRLERANRRMKLIGGALVAMVVTMAVGPSGPPTLRAQSFQVVDAKGNVLAVLGATNGNGSVLLYDRSGVLRDSLATSTDLISTGFVTYGTNGIQRTAEGVNEENTGGFADADDSGTIRAFIGHFASENQSGVFAYDPTGSALTGADVNPVQGFSGFVANIFDTGTASYKSRVLLGTFDSVTAPDTENLYLVDANGVFRAGLGADNPCCGSGNDLLFFNNSSNHLVGDFFAPNGAGGSYNTFDQNGSFTASLP
jgi:hypothetical protein